MTDGITSIWYVSWGHPPQPRRDGHYISGRYFQRLTDQQLLAWRPEGYHRFARSWNTNKANREYRRRAKRAGFATVYDWLRSIAQ